MKLLLGTIAALTLSITTAHAQCDASGLSVSVSPAAAQPGQPITVSLTNNTANCTYTLPSSCLFKTVYEGGVSGSAVVNLWCSSMLTPIAPGQTYSMMWDQLDDFGTQVMEGTYGFDISIYDGSFNKIKLMPTAVISSCSPAPVLYGESGAGTGDHLPKLGFIDAPRSGNPYFHLVVADGLGGAPAMLFVGAKPASIMTGWGTFLVDVTSPILSLPITLGGAPGAAGQGHLFVHAPIPSNPALVGAGGVLQTVIADPMSSGGLAHTNGLQLTICQ